MNITFRYQTVFGLLQISLLIILLMSCSTTVDPKNEETNILPSVNPSEDIDDAVEIGPRKPQNVTLPEKGPLHITVNDAGLMALENNLLLLVERSEPEIQKTYEDEEASDFDPVFEAGFSAGKTERQGPAIPGRPAVTSEEEVSEGRIALKEYFPSGTYVEADISSETIDSDTYNEPYSTTRIGLSLTQKLLRGYGTDVNLVRLRQARLDTEISQYELRAVSETLLADVESAYWDYALSQRQIEIVEESLKLSRQQMSETEAMIQVGTMAESELVAVQAEVASQQQGLINSKSTLESSRLRLLRLLNPKGENFWDRQISQVHPPELPEIELDVVATHVALALRMRPEINEAKLGIQKKDLEIVRTKNGLLPQLDIFIRLGKTGYADSFSSALRNIDEDGYDVRVGFELEYPILNRSAIALHQRATLKQDQAEKAMTNLNQLVELEVRNAYIEVNRTKEQVSAGAATRKLQVEKLRIEIEKFRVGRSTNFFVSQAQRDLLQSRISEVKTVVDYLKALINLYRFEGSLLERRGITAPGREPVEMDEKK